MKFNYPYCSIENVYKMFEFEFNQKMRSEHNWLKKKTSPFVHTFVHINVVYIYFMRKK